MSFMIKDWTTGLLHALVKRVEEAGGEGVAERMLREDFKVHFVPLLGDPLHAITTPGAERLMVDEAFKADKSSEVPIGSVGENFRRVFGGSVEERVPEGRLSMRPLMKASLDGPIIKTMGGKKRARVYLSDIFATMRHIGRPDKVVWVVGYVDDPNDSEVQWAVYASWDPDSGCWLVEASSVGSPFGWVGGNLFLSRDS